jgi:cell division protein FtsB
LEERARYELGMIKENEVFVQILHPEHKEDVKH